MASDTVQRLVQGIPIAFSYLLLISSWILFLVFVTIKQVLINSGETWRGVAQLVIFNSLLLLTALSYTVAISRRPLRPDQSAAPPDARPLLPDEVCEPIDGGRPGIRRESRSSGSHDDDDIPLRLLANGRSQINSTQQRLPLNHRDQSPTSAKRDEDDEDDDYDDAAENQALLKSEATDRNQVHTPIMAKGATGGPRWCRKCNGWKPDRCHHCRSCRQCVLKMDHHCPWLGNCVGYHNYKAFILFLTYGTLMSAYAAWQAGYEVYHFLKDPMKFESGKHAATQMDEMDDFRFALTPVVWMILAVLGGMFGIALGGLGGYHWYLMLNNRTTLEEMNRSVPTALLDPGTRAVLEELGPGGTRQRVPGAWRPDHILTRPERNRLRSEARDINVYDVGWRRNLRSVMCGDGAPPMHGWKDMINELAHGAWPLSKPRMRQYGGGHFFEHDPTALQQLKALTTEMRLGVENIETHSQPQTQSHELGEWTIGHYSDSDSESDE